MDLLALAAKRRAEGRGPADVRNIRPSLREFERYVTTQRAELAVIGELRRFDPDSGARMAVASPAAFVKSLQEAGCYGIAVCTDAVWEGSLDDLRAVSAAAEVPVLARGMVLDEQDLYRLRDAGADGAVVYAALHDATALASLRKAARSMHMEILVETTDDASLEVALASGCPLIGVQGGAGGAQRLAKVTVPRVPILVSGVSSVEAIAPLMSQIDAIVLNEALIRAGAEPGVVAGPFTTLV